MTTERPDEDTTLPIREPHYLSELDTQFDQ